MARSFRSLATLLESGVPVTRAFEVAADKAGDARARFALSEVAIATRRGEAISEAMASPAVGYPPLVIEMAEVAEQSGHFPEVFKQLSEHYENILRLRRTFRSAIAWPMFQLVASILIIALMIWVIGMVSASRVDGQAFDPLGFGLVGGTGAVIWLFVSFGTIAAFIGSVILIRRGLSGRRFLDGLFLKLPIIGTCLRDFAVARFSWAFALTQQTGMLVLNCLQTSLRATNNGAFQDAAPEVVARVKAGDQIAATLANTGLFPMEFNEMVSVSEETGEIPETLKRMGPQFEEQARRSLDRLVRGSGWMIWGIVAVFIIILIFRLAMFYVNTISSFEV